MRHFTTIPKGVVIAVLAAALALLGSASSAANATGVVETGQTCYLIDGQVYCIPSSASQSQGSHPAATVR